MARSKGGGRGGSRSDPLAGYTDAQIDRALSLGVIMGEEYDNLPGMALIAGGALNRAQNPSAFYSKSSVLGDVFAAPHNARSMARSILSGTALPNTGRARQYSATLPKERNAFAAVKAGLNAALRGTAVPANLQGRYDRAKVALDIASRAKALGINVNFGATFYGTIGRAASKAGVGPNRATFGGHQLGPYTRGNVPTQAELASRIAAAAAMTGVSIPRGMQAEIDRYTTPAQIAATASVMQMEAGLKNPGTFPGFSYGPGSMVGKTGHAAVDVPAIRDADLHVTPQGIAGWGQPSLSSLAGIPSAQQRSVGIPGEAPMGLLGWGVAPDDEDFRDYTDVLANEQLGHPELPGPLADLAPQNYPDITEGILHEGVVPDYSDITGQLYGNEPLGFTGSPTTGGPRADPNRGQQPDYSAISQGIFDTPERSTGSFYGESFPDITAGVNYTGDMVTSPTPISEPTSFGQYAGEVGYPSGSFSQAPNAPAAPADMSLAGLSPVGQGVVGQGYNPATVAAANPIGAPSTRSMSFDDMTRGITGYTTTTTQVPNPAYTAWEDSYAVPNSYQQAYLDDMDDKFPGRTPNFQGSVLNQAPATTRGPAPARTIDKTTRTAVYGDIPVGRPVSATLTAQPTTNPDYSVPLGGTWGGLDNWGGYMSGTGMLGSLAGLGVEGMTGTIGGGLSDPGNANASASAGGFAGGFGDARGGGYADNGQPLGGSENQGGAGASGTGGLY